MKFSNVSSGIGAMCIASLLFALMSAVAKKLAITGMSSFEIVFFRSFLMAIFILIPYFIGYLKHNNEKMILKKGGWNRLLFRSIVGALAMMAIFYNISTISLGTAVTFAQSVPLYAVLFGIIFLKEKIQLGIIVATIIGFCGVILISNPNFNDITTLNIILGIFSGAGTAIAYSALRGLRDSFSNVFIIIMFGVFSSVIPIIFILFNENEKFIVPDTIQWFYVILMGIFGTTGQYFLNVAYTKAPLGIISPIDYIRIIYAVILGVMLGDALPSLMNAFGMILVIVAGLIIALPSLIKDIKRIN